MCIRDSPCISKKAAAFPPKKEGQRLFLFGLQLQCFTGYIVPGDTGGGDFAQQGILGVCEEQVLVVGKVGFAAKGFDVPGGVEARGELGGEDHQLLAAGQAFVQKGESVRQIDVYKRQLLQLFGQ